MPRFRAIRIPALITALGALLALTADAFNSSLQPEEIEQAYSLGQTSNHEELFDFLGQLAHHLKGASGDSIAFAQSVEFETPYEQIVLRTMRTRNYTKFRAVADYRVNPRQVFVRVVVALKTGYAGPPPPPEKFKVLVL